LKGVLFGTKAYLSEVLRGTGRQANHLNQAGAFTRIPYNVGAAVDLVGNALFKGNQHNQFHVVMEAFWKPFREGKGIPTNSGYLKALREGLEAVTDTTTGAAKFTKKQIDALIELLLSS
jgi:hypothetical protein